MRRLKTVRRPPIYPKTPGHLPCSSLTHPLPLSSRRPSVSFGGFGVRKGSNIAELKPRVLAVISLMTQGHSNWGIAKRLGIQPKTVENYINCIYQALCLTHESDVHSRVHAVLSYLEYIGAPLAREYEPVG